jgi:hypothetical protein
VYILSDIERNEMQYSKNVSSMHSDVNFASLISSKKINFEIFLIYYSKEFHFIFISFSFHFILLDLNVVHCNITNNIM